MKLLPWIVAVGIVVPARAQAQTSTPASLVGTWKFDLKQDPKKDGPRTVVVRPDSSASYGTQTVRWRLVGDSLALALGGEWVNYKYKFKGKRLVLSGGDLTEPVSFDRLGPPTPRPDSVPVPPDPDVAESQ
ncbi:MAG TPA: hypothetical protein VH763_04225 [Gemmatimonadales bacterium]